MATPSNPQTWVPFDPPNDCSSNQCTMDCPQWCYLYFTPPPPSLFTEDASSNSPTLSPLVIALIGILVSAFLLITYYTIISKYCGVFDSIRTRVGGSSSVDGQPRRLEEWQAFPSEGLDESLISRIVVCKYRKGGGFVDGTDCPVCLSEFRDDESLRLLPNCCHAFHIHCIDTWLKSHSNCPICRADIVPANPVPSAETNSNHLVVDINVGTQRSEDVAVGGDGEANCREEVKQSAKEESSSSVVEVGNDIRQNERVDEPVGEALQMREEDQNGVLGGEEGSKNNGGSRDSNNVVIPVTMKSSASNERMSLDRHGRGKNSVLPV